MLSFMLSCTAQTVSTKYSYTKRWTLCYDPLSAEWSTAAGTRLFGGLDRLPGADASEPRLLPRPPQFLLVRGRFWPGLSRLGPLLLWRLRKYLSGHAVTAATSAATAAGREAFTKLWVSSQSTYICRVHKAVSGVFQNIDPPPPLSP